jgi:beta-glucosidase
MPNKENEMQMTPRQYPGVKPIVPDGAVACANPVPTNDTTGLNPRGGSGGSDCVPTQAYYDEKLLLGYRWYDTHKVVPAFPFGHGQSYTTFNYSDLQVNTSAASFTVTNSGTRLGSEVAQLYLTFPPFAREPPQQLKGFSKVGPLKPGEAHRVSIALTSRSFSVWSVEQHSWVVVSGEFGVAVGGSSRDQPLKAQLNIA